MRRGTTPEIVCSAAYDFSSCDDVWLTLEWSGGEATIKVADLDISNGQIKTTLTQEQTLALPNGYVRVQVKARTGEKVVASDITRVRVSDILNEEVME